MSEEDRISDKELDNILDLFAVQEVHNTNVKDISEDNSVKKPLTINVPKKTDNSRNIKKNENEKKPKVNKKDNKNSNTKQQKKTTETQDKGKLNSGFDETMKEQQMHEVEQLNKEEISDGDMSEQEGIDDIVEAAHKDLNDDYVETEPMTNREFNIYQNNIVHMEEENVPMNTEIEVQRENVVEMTNDNTNINTERTVRETTQIQTRYLVPDNDMTGIGVEYTDLLNTLILMRDKKTIEEYTVEDLNRLLKQDVIIGKLCNRTGNNNSVFSYIETTYVGDLLNILAESVKFAPESMLNGERSMSTSKGQKNEKFFSVQLKLYVRFRNGVETIVSGIGANSNTSLNATTSLKAADTDALKRAAIHLGNLFGWSLYRKSFIAKVQDTKHAMSLNDSRISSFTELRNLILTNLIALYGGTPSNIMEMFPEAKPKGAKDYRPVFRRILEDTSINQKINMILHIIRTKQELYYSKMNKTEKDKFEKYIVEEFQKQSNTKEKEIK